MIEFHTDRSISPEEFIDILKRSTLAERRPVGNIERIAAMLQHVNIIITAWNGPALIGISRALTDYSYCCYLSDIAVDVAYQKNGIGKELIKRTHEQAGMGCFL